MEKHMRLLAHKQMGLKSPRVKFPPAGQMRNEMPAQFAYLEQTKARLCKECKRVPSDLGRQNLATISSPAET